MAVGINREEDKVVNDKHEDIVTKLTDGEEIIELTKHGVFRVKADGTRTKIISPTNPLEDVVNNPSHYKHGGIETIELIKAFLSPEEWRGYLKGTLYAYRDRAPYKGQTERDYEKAKRYWEWLKEAMGETK